MEDLSVNAGDDEFSKLSVNASPTDVNFNCFVITGSAVVVVTSVENKEQAIDNKVILINTQCFLYVYTL